MGRKPTEKKVPAPKQRKHPSYEEMIYKAIAHKHSVKGSSIAAIHQFILNNYDDLPSNDAVKTQVRLSLKRLISRGSIEKVKASYKLADSTKEKLKKEKKSTKSSTTKKTRSTPEKKEPEKKPVKIAPKKITAKAPPKEKASPKKSPVKSPKKKTTGPKPKIAKASRSRAKATPPKTSSPKKSTQSPKKKPVASPTKRSTRQTRTTRSRK